LPTLTRRPMTNKLNRWLLVFGAICLGSCVGTASAQAPPRVPLLTSGWMAGFHYGVPVKWSMALAYVLPAMRDDWQPFAAAEPGIGGWRASIGALKSTGDLGRGYLVRVSALRTSKKKWRAPASTTFVGPELQFMPIFAIGARVGGFFRVQGKGERGLLTGDLSLLF